MFVLLMLLIGMIIGMGFNAVTTSLLTTFTVFYLCCEDMLMTEHENRQ